MDNFSEMIISLEAAKTRLFPLSDRGLTTQHAEPVWLSRTSSGPERRRLAVHVNVHAISLHNYHDAETGREVGRRYSAKK